MKTFICVVLMATTLFITCPQAHALFGHTTQEKERRQEVERQLIEQQAATKEQRTLTNRWQIVCTILGATVTIALVVGAAVGSKTRRDHGNL